MNTSSASKEKSISLVIFVCEGREELLRQTLSSLNKMVNYPFLEKILVIDGEINFSRVNHQYFDLVLHSPERLGYINSITNALRVIKTEFFFWLEDDWKFMCSIDVANLLHILEKNSEWVQIRLSKSAPVVGRSLGCNLLSSPSGFSANPCICNTQKIKLGFDALALEQRGTVLGQDGFENFLNRYYTSTNQVCAILDPGESITVKHIGSLERTGRNWHVTASIDTKVAFIAPLGNEQPTWRHILMLFKLAIKLATIGYAQFFRASAYDLAFRIVNVKEEI